MKTAFSALTLASAQHLHRGFVAAAATNLWAIRFEGAWSNRRLVIAGMTAVVEMPSNPHDPLALVLYVPSSASPEDVVKACRSFGASVERLWRDKNRGKFDRVVSAKDGYRHYVHAFHHVALCGHKSARWPSDAEVDPLAVESHSCAKCVSASTAMPGHRARWHPLVTDALPSA